MAALVPILIFAVTIGSIVGVVVWAQKRKAKRIAAAQALATAHGFEFKADSEPPPDLEFDHFDQGDSRKVSFQFWRPGHHDSVFHYQYSTGSGDDRTTHHSTCALVALRFRAPHTTIGPEGFWSRLGKRVGVHDIEVESPTFNERYRVRSDDDRFAITMLDGRAIDWFLDDADVSTNRFELRGLWLLCVTDRLDDELLLGFHDWAIGVPRHLPEVLTSLYPRE